MTREEVKDVLPILQAYSEGKEIQIKRGNEWITLHEYNFSGFRADLYRIKPEPTYKPFRNTDDLINHFLTKVFPVKTNADISNVILIWVKHKIDGRRRLIVGFGDNFVEIGNKSKPVSLEQLFETYTFLDGSPCGYEVIENGEKESNT